MSTPGSNAPKARNDREHAILEGIARKHLRVESLELRHSDHLDFHELSVGQIRRALEAAYRAGAESR